MALGSSVCPNCGQYHDTTGCPRPPIQVTGSGGAGTVDGVAITHGTEHVDIYMPDRISAAHRLIEASR